MTSRTIRPNVPCATADTALTPILRNSYAINARAASVTNDKTCHFATLVKMNSYEDLREAIIHGAVKRVRPTATTVMAAEVL